MVYGPTWATRGQKKYPETAEQGQFWRSTMLDMDSRLRVARGIAKTETQAAQEVFQTLKTRGHPEAPPPTISDGWGGIDAAMIEVYGQVPPYKGRGRPPSRKQAQPGWQYVQMVKPRQNGRVIGVKLRVIFGDATATLALLGQSTAYIERTHLTMRLFNGRLIRKTLAFSKQLDAVVSPKYGGSTLKTTSAKIKGRRRAPCPGQAKLRRLWRTCVKPGASIGVTRSQPV